jgi:SRSO17 transposase
MITGRQYIGEIGKTDNGIVVVTTHLYDGKKSLPLDLELYQHASSLPHYHQLRSYGAIAA